MTICRFPRDFGLETSLLAAALIMVAAAASE